MDSISSDIPLRQCTKCKQEFPATSEYFRTRSESQWRLSSWCRDCHRAYDHARHQTHYPTNVPNGYRRCTTCGEDLPATLEYFHALKLGKHGLNPQCRNCRKTYKREDKHLYEQRRSQKAYRKEQHRVASLNHLARKRAIPGKHTAQQIHEQYDRQKGQCYYCRKPVKWGKHHTDHTFPVSRASSDIPANDISYLVMTCMLCNTSKGNKYPWEWPEGGRLL